MPERNPDPGRDRHACVHQLDGAVHSVGLSHAECRGRDTPRHREETVATLELAVIQRGVIDREYRGRRR